MPETLPTVSPLAVLVLMLLIMSIGAAWIGLILRFALELPVLPPDTPRIVPWGLGSVVLTILVYVGIQFAVVNGYAAVTGPRALAADGARGDFTPGEKMILSAYMNAAVLILVPLTLARAAGARLRDFGMVREGVGKQFIRGVVAYPLLAPIVFGVMAVSVVYLGRTNHPLQDALLKDASPGMIAILVLAGVFFAPAAEELLFRGVLLGWLTRLAIGRSLPVGRKPDSSPMGSEEGHASLADANLDLILPAVDRSENFPNPFDQNSPNPYAAPTSTMTSTLETMAVDPTSRYLRLFLANVAVSLIFAALHGAVWPTPIPIFFLSMGLGLLYQRTGSILAPTILHMTFNGISTLLMLLTIGPSTPIDAPKIPVPPKPPAKVVSMLGTPIIPNEPIDDPAPGLYDLLPQRLRMTWEPGRSGVANSTSRVFLAERWREFSIRRCQRPICWGNKPIDEVSGHPAVGPG